MSENGSSGKKLTRRQKDGLRALLACATIKGAAEECRLSQTTLYRWLRLPHFKAALREQQDAVLLATVSQLVEALPDALATLVEIHTDVDVPPGVRCRAAAEVVSANLRYLEFASLVERVQALEEAMGVQQ